MPEAENPFIVAIPIYPGVDFLDIAAPCEIFSWMGNVSDGRPVKVFLAAKTHDPIRTRDDAQKNGVEVIPHRTFAELPKIDLLFVPGGGPVGLVDAGLDPDYMNFIQTRGAAAEWVTSVCEGALLLARSGLLNGYNATTHWAFYRCFKLFPEVHLVGGPPEKYPSYVVDDRRVTGGGISSGLEECMKLVELLAGADAATKVRRSIQYYPTQVPQELGKNETCPFGDLKDKWQPPVLPPPSE